MPRELLREVVTGDALSKVNVPSSGRVDAHVVEAGLIGPGLLDSIKGAQEREVESHSSASARRETE